MIEGIRQSSLKLSDTKSPPLGTFDPQEINVLELIRNFEKNFPRNIIKMKTKTVRELRSFARGKGLRGYYRLRKDDLVALLLEQSAEEIPTPPPRARRTERRPVPPVRIIPSPHEMDEFEKEEMKKSRPVVKDRLSELYDKLIDYIPKPIKKAVDKVFLGMKNSIMSLYDSARKTLKDIVEKEAEEQQQQEEDIYLIPHEHKH